MIDAVEEQGWSLPNRPHIYVSHNQKHIIGYTLGYTFLFMFVSAITIGIGQLIIKYGIIHILFWFGVAVGAVGAFVGLAYLVYLIKERYDEWRLGHPKKKKPNLLVEMFYAKKNKHCPLVQWED